MGVSIVIIGLVIGITNLAVVPCSFSEIILPFRSPFPVFHVEQPGLILSPDTDC